MTKEWFVIYSVLEVFLILIIAPEVLGGGASAEWFPLFIGTVIDGYLFSAFLFLSLSLSSFLLVRCVWCDDTCATSGSVSFVLNVPGDQSRPDQNEWILLIISNGCLFLPLFLSLSDWPLIKYTALGFTYVNVSHGLSIAYTTYISNFKNRISRNSK